MVVEGIMLDLYLDNTAISGLKWIRKSVGHNAVIGFLTWGSMEVRSVLLKMNLK